MKKKSPPSKKPARSKPRSAPKARPTRAAAPGSPKSRHARRPQQPFARGSDEVDAELEVAPPDVSDELPASSGSEVGDAADATEVSRTFPLEIDPRRVEESLKKVKDELVHWANKGRYTRVRFKFRGKQLLPDIPLAAVVAAEGLSFYWAGLLRLLVVNVAGGALLNVELVNDSEKVVAEGKQAILSGELDQAIALFRKASAMDRDNASAHLHLGVALKLQGDKEGARQSLERARALDPKGSVGQEAERVLSTMPPANLVVAATASQTSTPSAKPKPDA